MLKSVKFFLYSEVSKNVDICKYYFIKEHAYQVQTASRSAYATRYACQVCIARYELIRRQTPHLEEVM